jgi:steroid delta-isomerase-like uncharacterized protein
VHLPRGSTDSVFVDQLGIRYLLTSEDTDGHMTMLEIPCTPNSVVAPIHTHTLEDEFQVILEGEVCFELGGELIRAKAGDTVVQPREVPMAIWNPTDQPARLLVLFTPGGYDKYLKEVTPLIVAGNQPAMPAIWAKYGLTIDPSSIPRIMQQYGLRPQGGGPPSGGPPGGGPPGGGPPSGGPPSGGPPSGGPPGGGPPGGGPPGGGPSATVPPAPRPPSEAITPLQEKREALVLEHFRAENEHDLDGLIATFHSPRYEMMHLGRVHDGEEAVRTLISSLYRGLPDIHAEPGRLRHLGDAIVVECVTTGTHSGFFAGMQPTSKQIRARSVCIFEFDDDKLLCEKVYLDLATILRQLGAIPDLPAPPGPEGPTPAAGGPPSAAGQ